MESNSKSNNATLLACSWPVTQWGADSTPPDSGVRNVIFPISFATTNIQALASEGSAKGWDHSVTVYGTLMQPTQTSVYFNCINVVSNADWTLGKSCHFRWLAIGR